MYTLTINSCAHQSDNRKLIASGYEKAAVAANALGPVRAR
jgi:hypothetical protein